MTGLFPSISGVYRVVYMCLTQQLELQLNITGLIRVPGKLFIIPVMSYEDFGLQRVKVR